MRIVLTIFLVSKGQYAIVVAWGVGKTVGVYRKKIAAKIQSEQNKKRYVTLGSNSYKVCYCLGQTNSPYLGVSLILKDMSEEIMVKKVGWVDKSSLDKRSDRREIWDHFQQSEVCHKND